MPVPQYARAEPDISPAWRPESTVLNLPLIDDRITAPQLDDLPLRHPPQ